MTNTKHVVSAVLAAATLLLVLPPFLEAQKLVFPGAGPILAQIGIVPGSEPAWVAPVTGIAAIGLAAGAFVLSWNQKSFLVSGLLVVSGIVYTIGTMLAVVYLFGLAVPGPILGAISGLGILGLGVAKSIRTASMPAVIAR